MTGATAPISQRLLLCAGFVQPGAHVCDVGCDHGYLAIHLARTGAAAVLAADVAPGPLARARENVARYGLENRIRLRLTDGLAGISPGDCDTVVIAGMGGDCIQGILARCPWAADGRHRFILQPQTSGNDLRRWLGEQGWRIEDERLCRDAGRLYTAMLALPGGGRPLTPDEQYLSPALRRAGGPLLGEYAARIRAALAAAAAGLERSRRAADVPRRDYYRAALAGLEAWLAEQPAQEANHDDQS